jgi:hypothetical protein
MHHTPRVLQDATAEWLGEELGIQVDAVRLDQIAVGEGFMGQLARVFITSPHVATGSLPATMIVKLPTADPGGQFIGQMMRVWEREHCFYRDVAPHVNVRVPKVFVNIADPPCLVLEDLAPAVPGDHVAGATVDQADRSIDVLARHHAHWFEHPTLVEMDWMPGLDDPSMDALVPTFEMGWPSFLERYGNRLPARCLRWCEQFVADLPAWIGDHIDDPITLTHGDFRLDNLFFFDDGDVAIIDWQMAMRAPGQADLVYFCANNLTSSMRRTHEVRLIERYVNGLHAAGVPHDAVTMDGVRRGYLEGLIFYAATFGAGLLGIDPANDRGVALFDALVMRTFAAVDDLDAGQAIGLEPRT